MLKSYAFKIGGLVPYFVISAIWVYFAALNPIPFWQLGGDYPWYALSYAFTFEAVSAGHRAYNIGYSIHPSIPFGIVSWLSFRLSTLLIGDSTGRIIHAIQNAETFWLITTGFALLLNLIGIYILRTLYRASTLLTWLGVCVYFGVMTDAIFYVIVELTAESFALPFIAGFYLIAFRFFNASDTSFSLGGRLNGLFLSQRDVLAAAAGAAAAFGWSIKIYYLAPAVGLGVGCLMALYWRHITPRVFIRSAVAGTLGLVGVGALIVFSTMGAAGLSNWLQWNFSMLTHVDRYGSGPAGFVDPSALWTAWSDLTSRTRLRFPIALLVIAILSIGAASRGMADRSWRIKYAAYCVTVAVGLSINLLGTLKHYSSHYALPVLATLACLLVILDERAWRKVILGTAVGATAMLAANIATYAPLHFEQKRFAAAVMDDTARITSKPLEQGKMRVWAYFSPTKAGTLPLIRQYAGSEFVSSAMGPLFGSDISPADARDVAAWKYVIFFKNDFPTEAAIRATYRDRFDIAATNFVIGPEDKIEELDHFFVLTRDDR
jgi:hypothetical protein